jgi:SAM-dependent methyltransferase
MSSPASGQKTASEVEFFDSFAAEHGDYDVLSDGAYRRLTTLFQRFIGPRRGERCIDLGCGTGAFTRRLRSFGLDLVGMDISPASVELANRTADGERYIQGDITDTKLPDGSYDIVLYSGVLHHFDSPAGRIDVLTEGYRLLAPGGRLFAYDPNSHSPSMWLYRDPRSPLFSDKGKTENEVLLSRAQLTHELGVAGFARIQIHGVSGITYKFVESPFARFVLPLYNLYEHVVRFSPLENRIGTFVVSAASKG